MNPNPKHRFGKGNPGKPKGAKHKNTSLKELLYDCFSKNRKKAVLLLDGMVDNKNDFKWLCGLMATFEPKNGNGKGDIIVTIVIDRTSKQVASDDPSSRISIARTPISE